MEQQETRLLIELVHCASAEVGLAVVERLKQSTSVDTHSLDADLGERGIASFGIDLNVDRPVDELVGIARAAIPRNVRAKFAIWRFKDDDGEEAARLFSEAQPGWFNIDSSRPT